MFSNASEASCLLFREGRAWASSRNFLGFEKAAALPFFLDAFHTFASSGSTMLVAHLIISCFKICDLSLS